MPKCELPAECPSECVKMRTQNSITAWHFTVKKDSAFSAGEEGKRRIGMRSRQGNSRDEGSRGAMGFKTNRK